MKILRFIVSLALTIAIIIALNTRIGMVPPIGKFLDPVNGFWQNAETQEVRMPSTLEMAELQQPVSVLYDDNLVPHIFAQNENDLYFAQGYVTAYHRLWQMEMQTHAAAGRVSEIMGHSTLDFDRTQRRRGMVFGAENSMIGLAQIPEVNAALDSYAKGVNAFIASLDYSQLPFEYKLLDNAPESWAPIKSGLLLKYMSNTLNTGEKDVQNTNFRSLYGKEMLDLLYPDLENPQDPVVERIGQWDFEPLPVPRHVDMEGPAPILAAEGSDPNNGSNNWAVGPNKTANGYPILSNDPHLGLNLPSIWFLVQLNAPDINVFGASLPGTPFVTLGFNDSIAWGATNAQRDVVDWYAIKFRDETMNEYLLDGEWIPSEKKIEEFKIRGGESFYDTVTYTSWGPVFYDRSFLSNPKRKLEGYAYRWISHDSSAEAAALYYLNKAHNHGDYMRAMNLVGSPGQNFVFASVQGDIAMRVQGKYPLKAFEQGKFILDGSTSDNAWKAYIPNEHNVQVLNPERGFVSSANQYPVDSTYPYYITARSYEVYRNRRINQELSRMQNITPQDMMALQQDNYNLTAAESLPYFMEQIDKNQLNEEGGRIYDELESWDLFNNVNSLGASYYEEWRDILFPLIWDEIRNSELSLAYPTTFTTIKLLKENGDLMFFDNQKTDEVEDGTALIRKSFKLMVEEIVEYESENGPASWAKFKGTYIQHLARLKPLGAYEVQIGGNHDIVNAAESNHGPSWRMVVELDPNGVKGWGHFPGGQSGNPGSPWYDNMIESWAKGEYYELLFLTSAESGSDRIIFNQTLTPLVE